jgi:hypothetical protein
VAPRFPTFLVAAAPAVARRVAVARVLPAPPPLFVPADDPVAEAFPLVVVVVADVLTAMVLLVSSSGR